jgi:hypothetical protein
MPIELVEQVNYLRAKARVDRWNEDRIMIQDQMGNTIRYFQRMEAQWLQRAERTEQQSEGHRCYAYQQADIWSSLAQRAVKSFRKNAR